MPDPALLDRLAAHRTIGSAPREQLEWILNHGTLRQFRAGEVMARPGDPLIGLMILLTGHTTIRVNRGAGARKVMEWYAGDATGVLPYSRMTGTPGLVVADEESEIVIVETKHFPEMIRECHELTAILVHVMVDRARQFTSSDFQDEKLMSLGRLSAGLAHELNNPASAVTRSARALATNLPEALQAFRALGAARLPDTTLALIDDVADICVSTVDGTVRSPIQQADREDSFAEWLAAHGADEAAAGSLAESAVDLSALDRLAAVLEPGVLNDVLRALGVGCATRKLTSEIENAASRIDGLVAAVKGFTYMDQAAAPQMVDIPRGLRDTIAVLRNKARKKSISVSMDVPADLPKIPAYGGELNQVWGNLIDNALDAAPESGTVAITIRVEGPFLVVRVIDNGAGIPDHVRKRLFEPFFTTKPVGSGTGLGLDIARRLVGRHDGSIDVRSQPGRTEFAVALPLEGPRPLPDEGPAHAPAPSS